ncbi:HAD family hydrolase [Sulfuriflexus mobilis]|uniref:HAD family hydrolase n=1 Tax=Sulfuriflexus mobilis TaxID=1811807 RepID=UPI000F83B508|nr:HAD family phosphatase [Sulfuriflexus mobilis]
MTAGAIKAVLFDFGGVLAEEGFREGLMALAIEQGLDTGHIATQGMQAVYDSGFVLGKGTAAGFWALLRERTGLRGDDGLLSERILHGFVPRPWMLERVRQLRAQGVVTGILSDQTHWLDELDNRYHFSEAFDRIYNSYYLGKGKRDPGLFADVLADLNLPAAAVLFIDDDAGNVARAQAMGLQAIRYIDRQGFEAALEAILPD